MLAALPGSQVQVPLSSQLGGSREGRRFTYCIWHISPQNGFWLTPHWWCVWRQVHTNREPIWGLSHCFKFSRVQWLETSSWLWWPPGSESCLLVGRVIYKSLPYSVVRSSCSVSISAEQVQASNRCAGIFMYFLPKYVIFSQSFFGVILVILDRTGNSVFFATA